MSNHLEQQLAGCLALLQLQQEIRETQTPEQLGFVMVNRTMTILTATMIVLWCGVPGERGRIERVSGVAQLDVNAPFMVWIHQLLHTLAAGENGQRTHQVTSGDLAKQHTQEWAEWSEAYGVWSPVIAPNGTFFGGLWLVRNDPWQTSEIAMAEMLGKIFGHAWMALPTKSHWPTRTGHWSKKLVTNMTLFLVIALAWLPVTQSVLAPATVVALNPEVITAPLDGVIDMIEVRANAQVHAGEILLRMDQTKIRNQRDVVELALQVAQEKYARAQKVSFSDTETKTSLPLLRSQIKQQLAEVAYASERLERTVIRATRSGIAIFDNADEWRGKPVVIGERVMVIADPKQTELEILMPVEDAIMMQPGTKIFLFLNSDPLTPLEARLRYSGYEAKVTATGKLAYRLIAHFFATETQPRIGLQGTAKLLGQQVPLYYYLFRRPLTALRQAVGF